MIKHEDVYNLIKDKVGLKEDQEYQKLYNPDDIFGLSLRILALRHFKRFIAVLYYLLSERNIKFDLVLGAGDSGILLTKITEILYKKLNLTPPVILALPIVRFKYTYIRYEGQPLELFDNSVLIPQTKEKLKDLVKLENILYVDDEIAYGVTLSKAVKVVLKATDQSKQAKKINLTVVAEEQDFNPKEFFENVNLEVYPFAKRVKGIYGVINYMVPWEIEKQIKDHFSEEEVGSKVRLNMLLGLPSKEKEIIEDKLMPMPEFTDKYNQKAKKEIPNFSSLQKEMLNLIDKWISEAIEEYKN
ncbi:hypothetical protein HYW43_03030 [Candidatus Daviesbacteria bacterium]|nr:hypothetical protein [Candidatus Daviesbacteria bacterium]